MRRLGALAIFLLAAPTWAISVREYAGSLDRIRELLASKQIQQAHEQATALMGTEVDGGFLVDDTLLRSVIVATTPDVRLQSRLATTASQLRAASSGTVTAADQKLLSELEKQQSPDALKEGGEIFPAKVLNASIFERMAKAIGAALDWIGEKLGNFFDWLKKFWPDIKFKRSTPTAGMRWIVGAVVALIAIVIGVLAYEVVRRSRRRPLDLAVESEPASSARDADPLSRGANEWERYAAQLAAAGRIREAIRAWYHAVLVTLYGAGILHFRKGRTNWEYISTLAPALPWRGDFVRLTRRFEHEWYGASQSSPDALQDCRGVARQILTVVRRSESAE
jgi:hypothetical protein